MHRIAFVLSPEFQIISLAALSAFELANLTADRPVYDVRILSDGGGLVAASAPGVVLQSDPLDDSIYDTVIFAGGLETGGASHQTVDFARLSFDRARRVAAICTGAFVLAQAGLLDGRQVTTHWATADDLQMRYPALNVDADRIFIVDGAIWTSAGASAGVDLALGMVESDLGPEVARLVAKKLVLYHRRGGGQSQHSALLDMAAKSDRIQTALDFAKRNLERPIGVDDLADAAGLSSRQFSRAFRAETGQTPAKAIERLRVETARLMLEQTRHPIDVIANAAGFADRERMRLAFLRAFGQPPRAMRQLAQPGTRQEGIALRSRAAA